MKRVYRVTSLVVLMCFLFNSTVYDLSVHLPIDSTNVDKLAVPSIFNKLGGIEHKDIGRIKFALGIRLFEELKDLSTAEASKMDIDTLKAWLARLPKAQEETIFYPADIQLFFQEMKGLPNGCLAVKCRITDKKAYPRKRTYYVVFSPIKDEQGGFPIEVYTEKEYDYEKVKNAIELAKKMPERRSAVEDEIKRDAKAIDRYVQHEKIIDTWIREKMEDKDNYIRIEPLNMKEFLDIISAYGHIFQRLDSVFRGKLRNLLQTRNIVLIKVKKGEKRPVIYEDGEEIEVDSHISENNSYIFVDEEYIFPNYTSGTLTFDNFRRYLQYGIILDSDNKLYGFKAVFLGVAFAFADIAIIPKLFHIAGEMCGLPYEVRKGGKIINDMDRLYQAAKGKDLHDTLQIPLVKEIDKKLTLVNLNYLRGTPDRPYERDYALRIRPEGDDSSLWAEERIHQIIAIWEAAGEKVVNEPFSTEAQVAFGEILDLFELINEKSVTLPLDISNKIFYAVLFHKGNYKIIIYFFETIKKGLSEYLSSRTALLENKEVLTPLVTLYFTATMMDSKNVRRFAEQVKELKNTGFFEFYAKELFGIDVNADDVLGRTPDERAGFKERVINYITGFISRYSANGQYAEALRLLDNCEKCLEIEKKLAFLDIPKTTIDKRLKELADLRGKIITKIRPEDLENVFRYLGSEYGLMPTAFRELQGREHGDIARIMVGLQSTLQNIAQGKEHIEKHLFHRLGIVRASGDAIFSLPVEIFFNAAFYLPNDYVAVSCNVIGDKSPSRRAYLYVAIFSPQRDTDGNFPISAVYTRDESADLQEIVEQYARDNKFPQREKKDREAIERYIEHERYDQNVIRWVHNNKDVSVFVPQELGFSYRQMIDEIVERAALDLDKKDLESLKARECYIVPITAAVEERLKEYKVMVPLQDGTSEKVVAYCHSSNNAVHIFLQEQYVDGLRYATTHQWDDSATRYILGQIEERLAHEVGVMLGSSVLKFEDNRHINEIDLRYREKDLSRLEPKKYTVQDLDVNLLTRDYAFWFNQEKFISTVEKPMAHISLLDQINLYRRHLEYDKALQLIDELVDSLNNQNEVNLALQEDFSDSEVIEFILDLKKEIQNERDTGIDFGTIAQQGTAEVGPDDELTPQDLENKINTAWNAAGEKINDRFSPEAQESFDKINRLTSITVKPGVPFTRNVDIYYKICTAWLFGLGDCKKVIGFFEWVNDFRGDWASFRSEVLANKDFLFLYFAARRIDRESIEEADNLKKRFYEYYTERLFGDDSNLARTTWRYCTIEMPIFINLLLNFYKTKREYTKALELADNQIFFLRTQSKVNPDLRLMVQRGFLRLWFERRKEIEKARDAESNPEITAQQGTSEVGPNSEPAPDYKAIRTRQRKTLSHYAYGPYSGLQSNIAQAGLLMGGFDKGFLLRNFSKTVTDRRLMKLLPNSEKLVVLSTLLIEGDRPELQTTRIAYLLQTQRLSKLEEIIAHSLLLFFGKEDLAEKRKHIDALNDFLKSLNTRRKIIFTPELVARCALHIAGEYKENWGEIEDLLNAEESVSTPGINSKSKNRKEFYYRAAVTRAMLIIVGHKIGEQIRELEEYKQVKELGELIPSALINFAVEIRERLEKIGNRQVIDELKPYKDKPRLDYTAIRERQKEILADYAYRTNLERIIGYAGLLTGEFERKTMIKKLIDMDHEETLAYFERLVIRGTLLIAGDWPDLQIPKLASLLESPTLFKSWQIIGHSLLLVFGKEKERWNHRNALVGFLGGLGPDRKRISIPELVARCALDIAGERQEDWRQIESLLSDEEKNPALRSNEEYRKEFYLRAAVARAILFIIGYNMSEQIRKVEKYKEVKELGELIPSALINFAIKVREHLEKRSGSVALQGGPRSKDEAYGDIASMKDFHSLFEGVERKANLNRIYVDIIETVNEICSEFDKKYDMKTEEVGVVPGGEPGYTLVVNVNPQKRERRIGIYQSYIEGIYNNLVRFIDDRHWRAPEQRKVIKALIRGSVLHDVGHGFEGYSGMDLHTLVNDDKIRSEFVELLDLYDKVEKKDGTTEKVEMDKWKVAEAIADLNIGDKGNVNYVRNKGAYLFYKFISSEPKKYFNDNTKEIKEGVIHDKINNYYHNNPHLAKLLDSGDIAEVANEVVKDYNIFFGKGTPWYETNVIVEEIVEKNKIELQAEQLELETMRILISKATSKGIGKDERAKARTELATRFGKKAEIAVENRLKQVPPKSNEAIMLKLTIRDIRAHLRHNPGSEARQGDAEKPPELSLEQKRQQAIEEISESFTTAELRWLNDLMKKYPTNVEWRTRRAQEASDERLLRLGRILIRHKIPHAIPKNLPFRAGGRKLIVEACLLRQGRVIGHLEAALNPSLERTERVHATRKLADYGQDGLIALSFNWHHYKNNPNISNRHETLLHNVIIYILQEKTELDYITADNFARHIIRAFNPHLLTDLYSLHSSGRILAEYPKALKALAVVLQLVPAELEFRKPELNEDWKKLKIKERLYKLWDAVKEYQEGTSTARQGGSEIPPDTSQAAQSRKTIEGISESFNTRDLRWLKHLMQEYPTDADWRGAPSVIKSDERLIRFAQILNISNNITTELPGRLECCELLEKAHILREQKIMGLFDLVLNPRTPRKERNRATEELARYDQDALIVLSYSWYLARESTSWSYLHEFALRKVIAHLLMEKVQLDNSTAIILTEQILKAFNPNIQTKSFFIRTAGENLASCRDAQKALGILLKHVPLELELLDEAEAKNTWRALEIRTKLEELLEIAEKYQPGGTATWQGDSEVSTIGVIPHESQQDLERIITVAKEAGLEIPTHPNERYTLLLTSEFYANGELSTHKKEYEDRFNLDRVSGKTPKQFVDNILAKARGIESRTIALVPNNLPGTELARLRDVGIRFIMADVNTLLEARVNKDVYRKRFQINTYVMMLLARRIDESITEDSPIYKALSFYIMSHLVLSDDITVMEYIQAIVSNDVNDVATLIKGYLSYRPAAPYDTLEDYEKVAEALLSA